MTYSARNAEEERGQILTNRQAKFLQKGQAFFNINISLLFRNIEVNYLSLKLQQRFHVGQL